MMGQGIRDFVAGYERAFPGEVVHVTEPVTTDHDVMALVLEYERRREAGVTTTFNVLSFQRDLAAAQGNEIRAITDYNKSLANLEKVRGTVLERNRIEM